MMRSAVKANGNDVEAGSTTIPRCLKNDKTVRDVQTVTSFMPYWGWSEGMSRFKRLAIELNIYP